MYVTVLTLDGRTITADAHSDRILAVEHLEKKFAGLAGKKKRKTTLAVTGELWRTFTPAKKAAQLVYRLETQAGKVVKSSFLPGLEHAHVTVLD